MIQQQLKNNFSKKLIEYYQSHIKEYGEVISDEQACLDLDTLADLFLIFAKKSTHDNVKK